MSMNAVDVFRADVEDAEGIAAVHVRAFDVTYRDAFPELAASAPDLEARTASWEALLDPDTEAAFTLVAEQRRTAVGFCSLATPSREAGPDERTAEVAAFFVAPSRWGNGVGTALLTKALEELTADGWSAVTVWVLVENASARTFYERFGFAADGEGGPDPMTGRPKMRLRAELPAA